MRKAVPRPDALPRERQRCIDDLYYAVEPVFQANDRLERQLNRWKRAALVLAVTATVLAAVLILL